MRTPRNIFVINLAISDLLLCSFTIPFTLADSLTAFWELGPEMVMMIVLLMTMVLLIMVLMIMVLMRVMRPLKVEIHQSTYSLKILVSHKVHH